MRIETRYVHLHLYSYTKAIVFFLFFFFCFTDFFRNKVGGRNKNNKKRYDT